MVLLTAAVIWGFAFVAQRAGMEFVGPFTFNGIRFALGSLVLLPMIPSFRGLGTTAVHSTPRVRFWCLLGLAGFTLFLSANLQQFGLVHTTAGKAGFITGLYVVIVPIIGLFRRHRVGAFVWIGAGLGAAGLYLLSVTAAFSIAPGDSLVLASAFGWAVHVHLVGWLAERAHPLRVAIPQFAICATLSLVMAMCTESIRWAEILQAGWMIGYAGVLSVGVAYTLQIVGQRRIAPARAGIVLSFEAVFAALGGWLLLRETLSTRAAVGCLLMFLGMIWAQVRTRVHREREDHDSST